MGAHRVAVAAIVCWSVVLLLPSATVAQLQPIAGQQELLNLKYREDLSIESIAARLSRTENAVWQALFRLRQQLRLCIDGKLARPRS